MTGHPALDRALVRSAVWGLAVLLGLGGHLLTGGRVAPAAWTLVLLVPLIVAAPLGWLEAQSIRDRDRWFVWLCVTPPGLVLLLVFQAAYLERLLALGSAGDALTALLPPLQRELPALVAGGLALGVPLAMAGYRRVTHGGMGRPLLWSLAASLASCLLFLPSALAYLAIELLHGISDSLEARLRGGAEALPEGLSPSRLWLLAYLGHPSALRRLGSAAPCAPATIAEWARGIEPAGHEALERAALAPIRRLLLEGPPAPGWERVHAALAAWVDAPSPELAAAAVREADLARRPIDAREEHLRRLTGVIRPERWGRTASLAQALARLPEPEEVRAEVAAELSDWVLTGRMASFRVRTAETDARP